MHFWNFLKIILKILEYVLKLSKGLRFSSKRTWLVKFFENMNFRKIEYIFAIILWDDFEYLRKVTPPEINPAYTHIVLK